MLKSVLNTVRRGLTGPSEAEAWATWALGLVNHTPDMAFLQQYELQLLLVPDEMQDGLYQHSLLDIDNGESMFMCRALTKVKFSVYVRGYGKDAQVIPLDKKFASPYDPVPWAAQKGAPAAVIKGEIYAIRPHRFVELDKYKLNGVQ